MSSIRQTYSAEPATNLATSVGLIVRETDADELELCSAATQRPTGVLIEAANQVGGQCSVVVQGLAHVKLGAAFEVGVTILDFMSKADGTAIPYVAGASNFKVGRLLLKRNASSGDVVPCIVQISEGATE